MSLISGFDGDEYKDPEPKPYHARKFLLIPRRLSGRWCWGSHDVIMEWTWGGDVPHYYPARLASAEAAKLLTQ